MSVEIIQTLMASPRHLTFIAGKNLKEIYRVIKKC
jgi:hypothetical protein